MCENIPGKIDVLRIHQCATCDIVIEHIVLESVGVGIHVVEPVAQVVDVIVGYYRLVGE